MASQISHRLRRVADEIDNFVASYENFTDALLELSENLPEAWKKLLRAGGSKNPLKISLKAVGSKCCTELSERVKETIWSWVDQPKEIFYGQRERCGLVQSKLASPEYREALLSHLPTWVAAGLKYNKLSGNLGGKGSVVFLPQLGRTMYRCDCYNQPAQKDVTHAALTPWECRTAHDVIDSVFKYMWSKINQGPVIIPHDLLSEEMRKRGPTKQQPQVRKLRKQKRRNGEAQDRLLQAPRPTDNDSDPSAVIPVRVDADQGKDNF
ncbi:hypothetical protein ACJ73_03273 [Blastomyces percursus]|uniref:Uncharacterized protein n=1 Tax=Blastomyces percursus TaxID=1658174 RepID=A0A1J9QA93_9EURO|nr:hypothetical protein ACJ73_03273 [Blastomyces percursus]